MDSADSAGDVAPSAAAGVVQKVALGQQAHVAAFAAEAR
eukprot:CAMPEP_0171281452 /NCGR_PEP_ID=MMETSP0790-20130122/66410_1 /TAXON_ID=2925 /ORGANISM="Alexandrium catenella, Strain OF101" /LENGTH=38 /DNA_ID= /DNA_START= /DNA_END= /DNA_ORIENTATION=